MHEKVGFGVRTGHSSLFAPMVELRDISDLRCAAEHETLIRQ